MKISSFTTFEGRNIYCHKKCIRMDLDLQGYCETPSKNIPGFNEKLVKAIPELKTHRCGIDEEGGFVKRLKEGTYLAHISEHSIIALQNRLGLEAKYGKAREIKDDNYYIIFEYIYPNTAIHIGKVVIEFINSLIDNLPYDLEDKIEEIKKTLSKEQLGPSTLTICEEAKKRGIPLMRIGEGSIFQLGYGKHGKRIEATIGENTGTIAVDIACDKLLTKQILEYQCLPVALGSKVSNLKQLLSEAEFLKYPLVLKPRYGNQGKGVYANIKDDVELLESYNELRKNYDDIIVEEHVSGDDYRACVVDGEVVAVSKRIPPFVIGDGVKTVEQLIHDLNNDVLRGEGHEKPLTKIKIDDKLINHLKKKMLNLNEVIPNGKQIILRENANLSTGGLAIDCTDEICRENVEICKRVAAAVGLDICGIDIVCKDISKSLYTEGIIVEVNAAPGIRMHHYPCKGNSRNVAEKIVEMLFKEPIEKFPLVAVTGTNGKTTTTRLISHALQLWGRKVGMTTTGGIYINDKCIRKGDTTGPESAKTILLNREVDAAVLETARGGIVRSGLAYDLADVAVITNITDDHLGIDNINTLEELAHVKSLVGEAVKSDGYVVLNADDKMIPTILERMKSDIIFFSKDKNNEYLLKNMNQGGYGIYVDQGELYIEKAGEKISLINIKDIGITVDGNLQYNIENAMAACGALIGIGVDYETIKNGLATFYCNEELNPGRFNVYDIGEIKVILDYGHNIDGYRAVLEGLKNMKTNKLIGIIGVPGDRLERNIEEIGKISAQYFDEIYIKEDRDKRGREVGEVARILRNGVTSENFNEKALKIILDEKESLNCAIENAEPGDVIIIFFEEYLPL
ncbi:MAG: cyanophycin synthetase, partial [Clostridium sp.]